jgi:hypothetical protein
MRDSETRYNAMKSCKEQAYGEFATELAVVKQLDKIYSDILNKAHTLRSLRNHQLADCGLATKSYRSLHSAIDALENGYYEVAMTLLRSILENRNVIRYFAQFPDEAKEWLINGRKIDQSKIRDRLRLGAEEKEFYNVLSNLYAHPNKSDSLIPNIVDTASVEFHPYPYYDSNECRFSIGCWIRYAHDTISLLKDVIPPQQLGVDSTFVQTVMQVLQTSNDCANLIAQDSRDYTAKFTDQ